VAVKVAASEPRLSAAPEICVDRLLRLLSAPFLPLNLGWASATSSMSSAESLFEEIDYRRES